MFDDYHGPEPCRVCGTFDDLVQAVFIINGERPKPMCRRCMAERMNTVAHTCRCCGRTDLTRLTGMHTSPLDCDGNLQLQDRQVRNTASDDPAEREWHPEPDVVNRVLCASCCPAKLHDDDEWCSVMAPWPVPD